MHNRLIDVQQPHKPSGPKPKAKVYPPPPIRHQSWRDDAACVGDPDRAWVTVQSEVDADAAERLRAVCAGCPVVEQCRDAAMADRHFEGFAAGLWWRDANVAADRGLGKAAG